MRARGQEEIKGIWCITKDRKLSSSLIKAAAKGTAKVYISLLRVQVSHGGLHGNRHKTLIKVVCRNGLLEKKHVSFVLLVQY